jgi:gamma-D-glutamyl-L-lysine dipeptidyl-peptidase
LGLYGWIKTGEIPAYAEEITHNHNPYDYKFPERNVLLGQQFNVLNFHFMVLTFANCNVPVMPLRSEPSHRSEQVSQLLFGEKVEVLGIDNHEWARIRVFWDDYIGWCKVSQLSFLNRKEFGRASKFITASHTGKIIFSDAEMQLPLGAELFGIKSGKLDAGFFHGKFKGKKHTIKKLQINEVAIKAAALQYTNAPYQWGGRSVLGIDCSGLTQMAYKLCGFKLLRDASQQAQEGETVDFLQNARAGDLAFFDNEEGKITHVGILLDEATIIHATDTAGRVVTDRIDPGGIISTTLKKRTHNLRLVKRYF